MAEMFELDPADSLGAGAIGEPGARAFYLQARKESAQLTVLVEKEQVALLAAEAGAFLDQIDADYPDDAPEPDPSEAALREPAVPLFRARAIGIGFDPERSMVLLELREHGQEEAPTEEAPDGLAEGSPDELPDELTEALTDQLTEALAERLGGGDTGEVPDLDAGPAADDPAADDPAADDAEEGWVARIYATRHQVRAMLLRGAAAVTAGRPPCPLCDQPMDPDGHRCPRWN